MLLYTDGLVERRSESLTDGLDRLLREVAGHRDETVARLVPAVVRALHDPQHVDDVCVLAARVARPEHRSASLDRRDPQVYRRGARAVHERVPDERSDETQAAGRRPVEEPLSRKELLRLQRSAGNRAVRALIQRDPRHDRGHAGEQGMGFQLYRFEDGWAVVRGPSGAAGHGVTRPGEDGLMFNVRTKELDIVDNKSLKAEGNVGSATAIDPSRNLRRNLRDMIRYVRSQSLKDLPMRQEVLSRLNKTWSAIDDGRPLPARVRLLVTNYGGRSSGVTQRLADQGVRFVDVNQPVLVRPGTATPPLTGGTPPAPVTTPPATTGTPAPAKPAAGFAEQPAARRRQATRRQERQAA